MTMAASKDLKTILTKLQYSDDAKVVQQITAQMKQVQARMAGIWVRGYHLSLIHI